jgi:hypothetical protein
VFSSNRLICVHCVGMACSFVILCCVLLAYSLMSLSSFCSPSS